jgi:hypothetical protein
MLQALSLCTHIADADVLDEGRVQLAALVDLLQELEEDTIELSVLEATLACLGQGSTDGESDDNIVGVLLLTFAGGGCQYIGNKKIEASQDVFEKQRWATAAVGQEMGETYILAKGVVPGMNWETTD